MVLLASLSRLFLSHPAGVNNVQTVLTTEYIHKKNSTARNSTYFLLNEN